MIVYVVTTGSYSGYHIEAVFHDKEQAELFCATHGIHGDDIEEYDTEEYTIATKSPIHSRWQFDILEEYDDKFYMYEKCYAFDSVNKVEVIQCDSYRLIRIIITLSKDATREQAEKVAWDRYAEWKYNEFA